MGEEDRVQSLWYDIQAGLLRVDDMDLLFPSSESDAWYDVDFQRSAFYDGDVNPNVAWVKKPRTPVPQRCMGRAQRCMGQGGTTSSLSCRSSSPVRRSELTCWKETSVG